LPGTSWWLAELLSAFITAELMIEHVAEYGERTVPTILAIRARKGTPYRDGHSLPLV